MLTNATWNSSVLLDSGSDQEDYYYMNFLESNDTLTIPAKGKTPSSVAETVVIGVFLSIIILISIVGNSLVCVAVFKVRQMRKIGNFLSSFARHRRSSGVPSRHDICFS